RRANQEAIMAVPSPCGRVVPCLCMLLLATPALADWSEHGRTIATVRELLPRLRATSGMSISAPLAADSPVLLAAGTSVADPNARAVALPSRGVGANGQGGQMTPAATDTGGDLERAAPRLRQARAITPARAAPRVVTTGAVSLFGRLVEPPY